MLPRGFSDFSSLLSDERIVVEYSATADTAYFNLEARRIVLPILKKKTPDFVYLGQLYHEAFHALWTDPDEYKALCEQYNPSFINIIEDLRIESMGKAKYPGAARDLPRSWSYVLNANFKAAQLNNIHEMFINRMNWELKSNVDLFIPFTKDEKASIRKIEKFLESNVDASLTQFLSFLESNVPELAEFFKKEEAPQEPNEPEQGAPQDSDDESGAPQSDQGSPMPSDDDESEEQEGEEQEQEGAGSSNDDTESEEGDDEPADGESDSDDDASEENDTESPDDDSSESPDQSDAGDSAGNEGDTQEKPETLNRIVDDSISSMSSENKGKHTRINKIDLRGLLSDETPDLFNSTIWRDKGKCNLIELDDTHPIITELYPVAEATNSSELGMRIQNMVNDAAQNMLIKFQTYRDADNYANQTFEESGVLDLDGLGEYKIRDDLFIDDVIQPNQEHHAFLSLVDFSSSMISISPFTGKNTYRINSVVQQLINCLIMYRFSTLSGVEYRAVSYSNEFMRLFDTKEYTPAHNEKLFDAYIAGIVLSNEQVREHGLSNHRQSLMFPGFNYGGTPLFSIILSIPYLVRDFKDRKITIMVMTDGAPTDDTIESSLFGMDPYDVSAPNRVFFESNESFVRVDSPEKVYRNVKDVTDVMNIVLDFLQDYGFSVRMNYFLYRLMTKRSTFKSVLKHAKNLSRDAGIDMMAMPSLLNDELGYFDVNFDNGMTRIYVGVGSNDYRYYHGYGDTATDMIELSNAAYTNMAMINLSKMYLDDFLEFSV